MLSMSNVTSVAAAASYYAEDNYYSADENLAKSAWAGKGAEILGLSGPVDPAMFASILSGEVDGEQLGRVIGKGPDGELLREHRPGFDITLSPPKSVSLLALVGEQGDVRAAHEAAVDKVLEYLEKNLVVARVTEAGETSFDKTGNVVAAKFHHTTSRDLDPQMHTHLVIANATQMQNGHWRSIANELVYQNQKLLGNIYTTELAANLRALGYELEGGTGGRWEVAGFSREQIEHFSQRSQAIEARLLKFGLTRDSATAAQREDATLRTRASKKEVDHAALSADWKSRAAEQAIDFGMIEEKRLRGAETLPESATPGGKADDAVRFAIAHLTERESVTKIDQLLDTALNHAFRDSIQAGVTLEHVTASLDARIAEKAVLMTPGGDITTREALARENLMLAMLESGRGAMPAVLPLAKIDAAIADFEGNRTQQYGHAFQLTTGQAEAIRAALGSTDRFVGLQGYAGVGKTTMLELTRNSAESAGYTVRGMASSAQAAMTLQAESGIESVTTARFLLDEGRRAMEEASQQTLTLSGAIDLKGHELRTWSFEAPRSALNAYASKELWVMDEASLAGQREVTTVMEMAERAGARVIFVGDRLQLNAVEAGKPFEILQRAGIAGAEMTEISRQQVDDLRNAVAKAVHRENAAAFEHLANRIVEIGDRKPLLQRITGDILGKGAEDRHRALLIVPLNSDRLAINQQVREGLQERGEIGIDLLKRSVLVPTGFTDAQKQSTAYYAQDMMVRFGRSYKSIAIERGEYATVIDVKRDAHAVVLQKSDGRQVEWSPERNGKVEVYEQEQRHVAVGDEIRFTRNNKDMGVSNGALGTVTAVSGDVITLKTGASVLNLAPGEQSHSHWDYAYAMTVYASQGKTANEANLLITHDSGLAMGERSFYVGITRARNDLTIYTDSTVTALKLIQRGQDKTSAFEEMKSTGAQAGARAEDDVPSNAGPGSSGGRSAGAER